MLSLNKNLQPKNSVNSEKMTDHDYFFLMKPKSECLGLLQ